MTGEGWALAGLVVGLASCVSVVRAARARDRPGAVALSLLGVVLGGLALGIAGYRAWAPGAAWWGPAVQLVLLGGYACSSLLWIAFVFEYTGRGPAVTRRRGAGLAGLGVLAIASTTVTWLHETGRTPLGTIGRASFLSTFVLQVAVFSLGILGVVLIARSAIAYGDVSGGRAVGLAAGGLGISLLPLSVGFGQQFGRATTLSVTFLQLAGIVGAFAATQAHQGLFDPAPTAGHLARETVLETMTDPVAVVDRGNRLLDVNEAAADAFGIERTRLRERTLDAVAGVSEATDLGGPRSIQVATGRREFDVTRSAITDAGGAVIGYAYRFRDVTGRRTREQRVQVLNRVVRHNLRNDLDAIRGFAEGVRVDDASPGAADRHLERIESIATDLVDLASAVERSDRLVTTTPEVQRRDLRELARSAAERAGDVEVDTPPDPVAVRSDPGVVDLVLRELVDNACQHAGEDPFVRIVVRETPDGGTLEVHDDGPGIPATEQAVLLSGEETPVAHGSGIGLWLAYWGVTRLGGQLAFDDRDPRGSVVTASVPDLSPTGDDAEQSVTDDAKQSVTDDADPSRTNDDADPPA